MILYYYERFGLSIHFFIFSFFDKNVIELLSTFSEQSLTGDRTGKLKDGQMIKEMK